MINLVKRWNKTKFASLAKVALLLGIITFVTYMLVTYWMNNGMIDNKGIGVTIEHYTVRIYTISMLTFFVAGWIGIIESLIAIKKSKGSK